MHPNAAFRHGDRPLLETLLDEVSFGMVFAQTPDGPRVAHVPLLYKGGGAVQFHLARGNALTRHLDGATVLALVNGPDGYVSPRWYLDGGAENVPTWNYVALEIEGRVRRMDQDGLIGQITALSAKHEARIAKGKPWTMDKLSEARANGLIKSIAGFEIEVQAWRETLKLSQNKPDEDRAALADALEAEGAVAIAHMMRNLAP
ncbi:FMN-binding negative transcriptional regulator [Novosphingobium sp.]|uniref:FMN-binding negative transcriptional regulator n=1 Tax=Novosphingobium sp. TaxID=1874826 RepID=UPI00286BA2FC|nr:FMN-binding negative transcriptional regulator [Novosphingobium sp.]